jgi:putative sigma-54 modulation protein
MIESSDFDRRAVKPATSFVRSFKLIFSLIGGFMEIDVSGRHFKITKPLKDYIEEKIKKLDKFSLKVESVHVILSVEKFRQIAEIVVLAKNIRATAKEQSVDMYAAFDKCFGKIQLQFGRRHDKVRDHKGRRYATAAKKTKAQEKEE